MVVGWEVTAEGSISLTNNNLLQEEVEAVREGTESTTGAQEAERCFSKIRSTPLISIVAVSPRRLDWWARLTVATVHVRAGEGAVGVSLTQPLRPITAGMEITVAAGAEAAGTAEMVETEVSVAAAGAHKTRPIYSLDPLVVTVALEVAGNGGAGGGSAGLYGGLGSKDYGGGGGALGGAIFNTGGTLIVQNSTFYNNSVDRGNAGGSPADNGADAGGAIFSFNGRVTIQDSTISGNQSTGSGAGVVVVETDGTLDTVFVLDNTIIFNNGTTDANGNPAGTAAECSGFAKTLSGAGNLIQNNSGCPGVVTTGDPLLGTLQLNRGFTPTMAIGPTSAAFNTADTSTSLDVDQRGIPRPSDGGFDIGAFEYCDFARDFNCNIVGVAQTNPVTIIVSPPAGGTTTPGPGTTLEVQNTVTAVTATAAPGYLFLNWVGNVTFPTGTETTVIMNQSQTITAVFVPCGCATDVSAAITVTRGGFVLNPGTGRFVQTDTLTNNSANTITGPISLVLTGLSANAALYNATGSTDADLPPAGAPYVNSSAASLAPGQSISISLQFTNPTRAAICTPRNF